MRPNLCPGCAQRKLQMNTAPCEICGRVSEITPPRPREKTHLFARILRASLRPPGHFDHFLLAIFAVFTLWSMAIHHILPFLGLVMSGIALLGLLLFSLWTIRLLTRGAAWIFAPATRQMKRGGADRFLILPASLALLWALNQCDAPLRVAFWLSRPALERDVTITQTITFLFVPHRAGLYRVENAESNGPNVRFQIINNDFLWSGTSGGFARCPGGCSAAKLPSAYLRSFGAPQYFPLSNGWYWWQESGSDD